MEFGIYISLGVYFLLMLGVGFYGYLATKEGVSGFLLGGRSLSPSVTALSAGASDMSGWMLMGLPGAMYLSGVSSSWIAIGLVIGAYLNYLIVAPRLRVYTETAGDAVTIPEFFEHRFEDKRHFLRILSSAVIIIFFAIYTTSGLVAGGKLFETSFGLSYQLGLVVTVGVVVAYSIFGGFLAVSMTDFIQGCIMFVALIIVPVVALQQAGGASLAYEELITFDSSLLSLGGAPLLVIISAMSWGLGYFGQPHIIVRFMAIRSVKEIKIARRIGMSWMIVSLTGAVMVGLCGLAYVRATGSSLSDPETIFIFLSTTLFHPLVAGFLLAAVLAAIMSTISSQLLVTSSSLTEDFYHTFLRKKASAKELVLVGRVAVAFVAALACILALNPNNSVLKLVSHAWAGLGAAFGPIVLLSLFWNRMNLYGALAGMIVGAVTVLAWVYAPFTINGSSPSSFIFEIVPGFIFSCVAVISVSLFTKAPGGSVQKGFGKMKASLDAQLRS